MRRRMPRNPRDRNSREIAYDFLMDVWGYHTDGYVHLATKSVLSNAWSEHPIRVSRVSEDLWRLIHTMSFRSYDVYFCPNAFSDRQRKSDSALPTPFAWADIDDADPRRFKPKPSVLWRTSPGRYQGLWVWPQHLPATEAQALSKQLAYEFGADRSGWDLGQMLRVPGTYNHKPRYNRPVIQLLASDFTPQGRPPLEAHHRSQKVSPPKKKHHFIPSDEAAARDKAIAILKGHRESLKGNAQLILIELQSDKLQNVSGCVDRSVRIYERIRSLDGSGLSLDEICAVMWVERYFRSKHGRDPARLESEVNRCLAKIRAKREVQ